MSKRFLANGYEYAAGEVTLPFSWSAKVSDAPRPPSLDFRREPNPDNCQVFVRIEGELWQFRCPWILGKPIVMRYRGPDIDHLARVEDGAYPEGLTTCWFLGGMWYDESAGKLYAPLHIEQSGIHRHHPVALWPSRKIGLATSTDKGATWRWEGDIVTPPTYFYDHDTYRFSGSCYGNGVADFGFYVDSRGGYFYLFPEESWYLKGKFGCFWNVRAARCAIADRMSPGAWKYFHEGAWEEPALGGRSSTVAPSHLWGIIYSSHLGRYVCMFPSNMDPVTPDNVDGVCIGTCSDLAAQDWVWGFCPEAQFGFLNLVNAEGTDLASCDRTFRCYTYSAGNTFQRLDITLERGSRTTTDVAPRYHHEPHPESSDPVLARATRIVGPEGADVTRIGTWIRRADPECFGGGCHESAAAGSSMELAFSGSAVYWSAVRSPSSGKADVYLDGSRCATVDCWSPRSTSCHQFAFIRTGLDARTPHTIRIVVRGDRNPNSRGVTIGHIAFEHGAESYRAAAGFSSVVGKNCWRYEQGEGDERSDLRFLASDVVMTNYWYGDGTCAIGPDYQIPGELAAVRTWVAPHGGTVRIEGTPTFSALALPGCEGVTAGIVKNDTALWPATAPAVGSPVSHDIIAEVAQGDRIRFVVARKGATLDFQRVLWDPVVTYTRAEPAVWTPNPPCTRNLALGAYARSKTLWCGYRPFEAVDDLPGTAFVINRDDPITSGDDWLMLDLEGTFVIDRWVVVSRPRDPSYRIARFALQKSADGYAWTDVDTVETAAGERVERGVSGFTARYVRLYLPAGKPFCVNAFELYRTGGAPLEH